jgi:hypothetical protein
MTDVQIEQHGRRMPLNSKIKRYANVDTVQIQVRAERKEMTQDVQRNEALITIPPFPDFQIHGDTYPMIMSMHDTFLQFSQSFFPRPVPMPYPFPNPPPFTP